MDRNDLASILDEDVKIMLAKDSGDDPEAKQSGLITMKELYSVIVSSLTMSRGAIGAVPIESLTVGWLGVVRAHANFVEEVTGRHHEHRGDVQEWLRQAKWAKAFYPEAPLDELVKAIGLEEGSIAYHQPTSAAMLPAHFIAIEPRHRRVVLVVRGTSSIADVFTDVVAHCERVGTAGAAHSGMLQCARNILDGCLSLLAHVLHINPGFEVQLVGHSLGGGVASLMALLLHTDSAYVNALGGARVTCTGFGVPPVVSADLADSCAAYVTTIVNNNDVVPRACVANLSKLRSELLALADDFFTSNPVARVLRDSGALAVTKTLLAEVAAYYAGSLTPMGLVTRLAGARSGAARAAVRIGFGALATSLTAWRSAAARSQSPAAHAIKEEAAVSVTAVAAEATAVVGSAASTSSASAGPAAAPQGSKPQEGGEEVACPSSGPLTPADAAQQLYSPGQVYFIRRDGTAELPMFDLLRLDSGCRLQRILLRKGALEDHYMYSYIAALQGVGGEPAACTVLNPLRCAEGLI